MKRALIAFFVCVVCLFGGLSFANTVQAAPMPVADATAADPFTELKSKIIPELEKILTPEQKAQFQDAVSNGTSLKKAFKSITLTPEQKTQVGTMLKSVPKDYFATLTPEQKRDLFMQKGQYFMEQGKAKAKAAVKGTKGEYFMEQGKAKAEAAMKAMQEAVENVKEAVTD